MLFLNHSFTCQCTMSRQTYPEGTLPPHGARQHTTGQIPTKFHLTWLSFNGKKDEKIPGQAGMRQMGRFRTQEGGRRVPSFRGRGERGGQSMQESTWESHPSPTLRKERKFPSPHPHPHHSTPPQHLSVPSLLPTTPGERGGFEKGGR